MIKLEKILERKVSEIEELYNYDFTDETRLQKLKKERAEQKYTREVRYQMLENHLGSHPFDSVMNKIDAMIDQAIDRALDDGVTKENYQEVMALQDKQLAMHTKIYVTTIYNEKNGYYEPSDNVWLYHFVRTRVENPIYPYH